MMHSKTLYSKISDNNINIKMNLNPNMNNIPEIFEGQLDSYECKFELQAQILKINIVNRSSYHRYAIDIDETYLKESKNLNFFFMTTSELYAYLTFSFQTLTITKNGTIMFNIQVKIGQMLKKYECAIDTEIHEIDEKQLFAIKINHLQLEITYIHEENQNIKNKLNEQMRFQKVSEQRILQYEKIVENKDEIINSIFQELKQFKKWKEQYEKNERQKNLKNKFILDQTNPLAKKFKKIGNKIKKTSGGSWDVIMNQIPISRTQISQFRIRQIKSGQNGSFMYGIGSDKIKGINRAQDSLYFIGYYEHTGIVYEQGSSRKGGSKVKDGYVLTVFVDPLKWKIYWEIQGKRQAQAQIPPEMRQNNIYLSIIVYNNEAELEFI